MDSDTSSVSPRGLAQHVHMLADLESTKFPPDSAVTVSTYKEVIDLLPPVTGMIIDYDTKENAPLICVGSTAGAQIFAHYDGTLWMKEIKRPDNFRQSKMWIDNMLAPFSWSHHQRGNMMQDSFGALGKANDNLCGLVQVYLLKWAVQADHHKLLPKPSSKRVREGLKAVWQTKECKARLETRITEEQKQNAGQPESGVAINERVYERLASQSSQKTATASDREAEDVANIERDRDSPDTCQTQPNQDSALEGDSENESDQDEVERSREKEEDGEKEIEDEEDGEEEVEADRTELEGTEEDDEDDEDLSEHTDIEAEGLKAYKNRAISALEILRENVPEHLLTLLPGLKTMTLLPYSFRGYLNIVLKLGHFRKTAAFARRGQEIWAVFEVSKRHGTVLRLQLSDGPGRGFVAALTELQHMRTPAFELNPAFQTARTRDEYRAVIKYYFMLAAVEQIHGFLDAQVEPEGKSFRLFVTHLREVCERLQAPVQSPEVQQSVRPPSSPTVSVIGADPTDVAQRNSRSSSISDTLAPGVHSQFTPMNGPHWLGARADEEVMDQHDSRNAGPDFLEIFSPASADVVEEGTVFSAALAPQRCNPTRRPREEETESFTAEIEEPLKKRRQASPTLNIPTDKQAQDEQSNLAPDPGSCTSSTSFNAGTQVIERVLEPSVDNEDDTTLVEQDQAHSQSLAQKDRLAMAKGIKYGKLYAQALTGKMSTETAKSLGKIGQEYGSDVPVPRHCADTPFSKNRPRSQETGSLSIAQE
ncbi:hypothetical protein K491DRAFT_682419 [Lophiostoma macrostomum CBS 122681]|uniref:Uncharacterized protein n=1 Tax=Lophiostoma macrostomum CBS 122681 TaxID=1314788 RepID=A0A6A6SY87_9PLEO|nr:hypothetical protein K491DRAFT_682419 [Lophiostoma macrostomum CBS 122681]